MKTSRAVYVWCLLFFSVLKVNGQSSLIPKYEIGVHVGAFIYPGDLTPYDLGAFNTMKPGFGLSATRNMNSLYALRFQLMRARRDAKGVAATGFNFKTGH
jgi:hypothetical protein